MSAAVIEQADLFSGGYETADRWRARHRALWALSGHDGGIGCCTGGPTDEPMSARCGRCGTLAHVGDLAVNHDRMYGGCTAWIDPALGHLWRTTYVDDYTLEGHRSPHVWTPMPVDALCVRHDRAHFPDCIVCGHPWGVHGRGGSLQADFGYCVVHCGCRQYLAPPGATGPTGLCPVCFDTPHEATCPEVSA